MTKIRLWNRLLIMGLVVVLIISLTAGCSNVQRQSNNIVEKGVIKIGYVNWAECIAVSNLWKVILEEQNYKVELTQLDVAPLFVGLSKGDIDVFMDSWLPVTHETYWKEYQNSLEDYGVWYQEKARIGIVVPEYVTIDSIIQLKENTDKFNGKIIGIDPGAGIMKAADSANKTYGLGFEVVQGSEPAMMAALDKAYSKNEWIAITGWSPHWMFAKYKLKYLSDPEKEFVKQKRSIF
jgi:glycine betaine/proline transport system substrate-binding protein